MKTKKMIVTLLAMIMITATLIASSFAWFRSNENLLKPNVEGALVTEYFHCGSGSKDDPFVITRPIHYYHMIEFFQRITSLPTVYYDSNNVQQSGVVKFSAQYLYFQIGTTLDAMYSDTTGDGNFYVYDYDVDGKVKKDASGRELYSQTLNMAYYSGDNALMPLGTSEIPFNGQIDGSGIIIDNLNITTTSQVQVVNADGTKQDVTRHTSDVGIFGYVGQGASDPVTLEPRDNVIKNMYFTNLTIDVTDVDKTALTSQVEDTTHDATVHATDKAYVGFIAGHIVESATCNGVYINDCTIVGGATANCNFGYFGYVELSDKTAPAASFVDDIAELRAAGDKAGFGGSIDMYEMYGRLNTIQGLANTNYKYLTSKHKNIDEVKNTVTYSDFVYAGSVGDYPGYGTDTAGVYIFADRSAGNSYKFMAGLTQSQTTTIYIYYIKEDPDNPGEYLYDPGFILAYGTNYLGLGTGTTLASTTQANAQPFVWEGNYLYTRYDGEKWYLNRSGSTYNVVLSKTATTQWSLADDELVTDISGYDYYLYYDSGWVLGRKETYRLTDGTHYLTASTTAVSNTDDINASTKWIPSSPTGTTTDFSFTTANGNKYYLGFSNGNLTVSNTATTWRKGTYGYYYRSNNLVYYYIVYDNGTWKALPLTGYKISDGNGHYLSATSATTVGNTDVADATIWQYNGGLFFTEYNGNRVYLYNDGGGLALSSNFTDWYESNGSIYCEDNGKVYYLTYDNGWTLTELAYTLIHDGNNYLRVTGENAFANTTNQANATRFYFSNSANDSGTVYAVVGGTKYYLRNTVTNNEGKLQTTTNVSTATSWTNANGSIYVETNGYTYALRRNGNTWDIQNATYFYITDGNGNYLRATGTGNTDYTNTTDINQASRWTFSTSGTNPAGTISTTVGTNATAYLRNYDTGTLRMTGNSGNATTWLNDGNNIYSGTGDNRRYLIYDSGWKLNANTSVTRYTISYTVNNVKYYVGANGTTITAVTNEADALLFSGTSGNISTTINGTTRYLYSGTGGSPALSLSTNNNRSWTNDGGKLYFINNSRHYYIILDGTALAMARSGTTNANHDAAVTLTFNQKTITYKSIVQKVTDTLATATATTITITPPTLTKTDMTRTEPTLNVNKVIEDYSLTTADKGLQVVEKSSVTETDRTGTYFPVRPNSADDPNAEDPYGASPKNTGYVIGGRNYPGSGNDNYHSDIRISQYAIRNNISSCYTTTDCIITDGLGNYLKVNGTTISNTNKFTEATIFTVSSAAVNSTGTFQVKGTTRDYLRNNNGSLEIYSGTTTGNRTSWSNDGMNLYNGGRYLIFNGANWTLTETQPANEGEETTYSLAKHVVATVRTIDGTGDHELPNTGDGIVKNQGTFVTSMIQFGEMLSNNNTNVFGLHFMDAAIDMRHIITAKQATILSQTYYNYEFPEDCIDFRAVERGTISFFAGTYYTYGGNNDSFFSLHSIERDSDHKITAIKEIKKVYGKLKEGSSTDVDPDSDYFYVCDDEEDIYAGNGYLMLFDTSWIASTRSLTMRAVYYFEIPCNAGEYALGSTDGNGAYLMYLDIGANGGNKIEAIVSQKGNIVTDKFDVDFRYLTDNKEDYAMLQFNVVVPESNNENFSIKVNFDSTETKPNPEDPDDIYAKGLYTIYITNNSNTDVDIYIFLCDDDEDPYNNYDYAYRIVYTNGDHTDEIYVNETTAQNYSKQLAGYKVPTEGVVTEIDYATLINGDSSGS